MYKYLLFLNKLYAFEARKYTDGECFIHVCWLISGPCNTSDHIHVIKTAQNLALMLYSVIQNQNSHEQLVRMWIGYSPLDRNLSVSINILNVYILT